MMNFLSAALPPPERAAGYARALQQFFSTLSSNVRAQVDIDGAEQVEASIEPISIGHLRGGVHRCNSPHRLDVPPTGSRHLDFYLMYDGELSLAGPESEIHLRAGDMAVWRTGTGWQAASGRFRMIALGLPERLLRHRAPDLPWAAGRRIEGTSALATCLAALLRQAAECHGTLMSEEGAVLENAVLDALCVLGSPREAPGSRRISGAEEERFNRLKALAFRSLEHPGLTPASLAERAGMSTRTVHRLFAASGSTFQDWVRERRLERCWLELTDPGRQAATIAAVAFRSGFADLSTFNRAFRSRFGMTPRAARESSRNGGASGMRGTPDTIDIRKG